ncbi:MAG TPA: hypothetical protein VGD98_18145 [Ktedonobacteraceae bacterium]
MMEPDDQEEPFAADLQVKITDLPGHTRTKRLTHMPRADLMARLLRRRWFQLVCLLLLAFSCIALILKTTPDTRLFSNPFAGSTPTNSSSLDFNLFYVNAGLPWGRLTIDGKPVTALPVVEQNSPLQLTPGTHQFHWQAAPFPDQLCSISVPRNSEDNCQATLTKHTPGQHTAWIINLRASLNFMATDAHRNLISAITQTLAQFSASEFVYPGEHFIDPINGNYGPIRIAKQQLIATFNLSLYSGNNSNNDPCDGGDSFASCQLNGQDCLALCTEPATASHTWNAVALVESSWTYTTLNGQLVAAHVADELGGAAIFAHFLPLQLSWDGLHWQIQAGKAFLNGPNHPDPLPISCASAADSNAINPNLPFGNSPWQAFTWNYIGASNLAAGCLLLLTAYSLNSPSSITSAQIIYLHRFGLTLAVNHLAQEYDPAMPRPDANERTLAQNIATQAHIPFS